MTTVIEEKQLNEELKEFSSISERWIAELDVLNRGCVEMYKLYSSVSISDNGIYEAEKVNAFLELISKSIHQANELKARTKSHVAVICHLIDSDDTGYSLSLIEEHTRLDLEIHNLIGSAKTLKKSAERLFAQF